MIKSFRRRTRSLPFPRSEAGHAFSPNKNLAAGKKTRRAPTLDRREFFFAIKTLPTEQRESGQHNLLVIDSFGYSDHVRKSGGGGKIIWEYPKVP